MVNVLVVLWFIGLIFCLYTAWLGFRSEWWKLFFRFILWIYPATRETKFYELHEAPSKEVLRMRQVIAYARKKHQTLNSLFDRWSKFCGKQNLLHLLMNKTNRESNQTAGNPADDYQRPQKKPVVTFESPS